MYVTNALIFPGEMNNVIAFKVFVFKPLLYLRFAFEEFCVANWLLHLKKLAFAI